MNFQALWLDAIAEEKNEADPAVPHIFSASDMPVATGGVRVAPSEIEDAEYVLLVCQAASHTHNIDLHDVGGVPGRHLELRFPSFEECCQHPMLSYIHSGSTLEHMRSRCPSESIMSLSFSCNVTPSGRFITTEDGIRVTGTNLEEDRILYVTTDRGRSLANRDFDQTDYAGVLHRMILNSYENIRRRQLGFSHTRCENVARSSVLALLKIGEAMIDTVQNIATAVKAGVGSQEILWKENGITIRAGDLLSLEGFDHDKDCEGKLDPLIDLLLSAANRDVIGARKGVPRRISLAAEEHCIERRLLDYSKAVVLNNPSKISKYAIRCATLEALIEVSGLEATLYSLCTSSMAKELSGNENFYAAMQLESLLGLKCHMLANLSLPLTVPEMTIVLNVLAIKFSRHAS